jgi:hypothetical protein
MKYVRPLTTLAVVVATVLAATPVGATPGALVRVISAPRYHFVTPNGIASDGTHLWVANEGGQSVTEY